ncbi:hypothetical protein D3C76_1572660 [compost metagenome]
MGGRPEGRDKAAHLALAVTGQQYTQVQFAEADTRPQQGDRQQSEQQAWPGGGITGGTTQHRGICTLKEGTGVGEGCNCSLA